MTVFDYTVKQIGGNDFPLSQYKDYVLLIVNTASAWGFTPQFQGLEQIYQDYKDKKFAVIGFPCNQFGQQDPGTNEEIRNFCKINFGVTFPVMAKTEVNGENEDALFTFLKKQAVNAPDKPIKWNFTKFLVDRSGSAVTRFESPVEPDELKTDIEKLL